MIKRICIYLTLLTLFQQCANIQVPGGGQKDIFPPKVLTSYPDSAAVNVQPEQIVLHFNEYVVIKNLQSQLLISPPLEKPVSHVIKGKKLIIKLNQPLQDSTTYQFNFGNSITDLNEGNELTNYSVVFSTGAEIDSLSFGGKVTDYLTNKAVGNCLIMLYKDYNDSSLLKDMPLYVTRSNDSGYYQFRHLKDGEYYLLALHDINGNFHLEKGEFAHRYPLSPLRPDNQNILLKVVAWDPILPLKIKSQLTTAPGAFKLIFNRPLTPIEKVDLKLNYSDHRKKPLIPQHLTSSRDTFLFYLANYEDTSRVTGFAFVGPDTFPIDIKPFHFKPTKHTTLKQTQTFEKPGPEGIVLRYSRPVINLTQTKSVLIKDSIIVDSFDILPTDNPIEIRIKYPFDGKSQYLFIADTGFITDVYGFPSLLDTVRLKIQSADNLGNLKITVNRNDTIPVPVYFQLVSQGDKVIAEQKLENDTLFKIDYLYINPGKYHFRYFFDLNKNGQWDAGNILVGEQPEPYFNLPHTTEVRAKWTVEDVIVTIE